MTEHSLPAALAAALATKGYSTLTSVQEAVLVPEAAGRDARIGRHEAHRIVAPGIGKAEGRQVALVDPRSKRHEFDGIDAKPLEMRKKRRL